MNKFCTNLLLLLFFLTACQVQQRDPVTPIPTHKKVSTDFFFNFNEDRTSYTPKRFLFGQSVEDRTGRYEGLFQDHLNTAGSANLEFEFNDDGTRLIARRVNPSYPNNKNKWPILLSFRISDSYYEENRVDGSGRTSTDVIRRRDKSDPRARPFIEVELDSMEMGEAFLGRSRWQEKSIEKVYDVEWDEKGGFLGFTALTTSRRAGSLAQSTDRINFLRITPNEKDFIETPYHKDNDTTMQVIDVVSSRPNHFGEKLKVAHWDINRKTKKTHTIYLHNFPNEFLQLGIDSIESWNDAFEEVVGYRPLKHDISKSKYAFDLRYHTIHWVDDIRLSASRSLGLANMAADVTNGKIIWTGSIIWGGLLDQYAGNSLPSLSPTTNRSSGLGHNLMTILPSSMQTWDTPNIPLSERGNFEGRFLNYMSQSFRQQNQAWIDSKTNERSTLLHEKVAKGELSEFEIPRLLQEYRAYLQTSNSEYLTSPDDFFDHYEKMMEMEPLNEVDMDDAIAHLRYNPISLKSIANELGANNPIPEDEPLHLPFLSKDSPTYKNLPDEIKEKVTLDAHGHLSHSFDIEESAYDTLMGTNSAIAKIREEGKLVDVEDVKRSMIRKTITHEIGHTLGLAHNFKSNIMPEKGEVPDRIYGPLHKKAMNGMTNKSSIMGYPAPETIVLTHQSEQIPGINDVNRLMFIYEKKYPMYAKEDAGKGDYHWENLKGDGRIAKSINKKGKTLTPAYLPNCNDYEASFYMDPYCARHDRGYNAQTLVDSYFSRYWETLYNMLESSIDSLKTRNYTALENYLWYATSRVMSRSRFFHDFMRLKYSEKIEDLKDGDIVKTYENMMDFAKQCRAVDKKNSEELATMAQNNPGVEKFLKQDPDGKTVVNEFGDLCLATLSYFENMTRLLEIEGKEYTQIDYFNRRTPCCLRSGEGQLSFEQMYGSWKRIGLTPLKFKIMQNLLTPFPYMTLGRMDFPLFPYYREDTSFSMSTLFPAEYLGVIKTLVQSALNFKDKDNQPRISRSLLYLGYFLRLQEASSDSRVFPTQILDAISAQTQFRYSGAFIKVVANKEDGTDFAKTFKGSIYNRYNTSGEEGLGNIYLYSLQRFITNAQANSLILPLTPIRWQTEKQGSAVAIKLDYASNIDFEELEDHSPRKFFIEEYSKPIKDCIEGYNDEADNGLSSYFYDSKEGDGDIEYQYKGIEIPSDVFSRTSAYKQINSSVSMALQNFTAKTDFDLNYCEKALNSQKILVLGGALMNGFFFPETFRILQRRTQ